MIIIKDLKIPFHYKILIFPYNNLMHQHFHNQFFQVENFFEEIQKLYHRQKYLLINHHNYIFRYLHILEVVH
jgi:hypothetical protein